MKWWALGLFILFCIWITIAPAFSHNWYDKQCCSNKDCAEAIRSQWHKDGTVTVTTKHGTATYRPSQIPNHRRMSEDGKLHACMRPYPANYNKNAFGVCLYLPGVS